MIELRDVQQQQNGKMWELFPSRNLRNIFGFHKNVYFLGGILVSKSGDGWPPPPPPPPPPPLREKLPPYPVFFEFCTEWALEDPKQD